MTNVIYEPLFGLKYMFVVLVVFGVLQKCLILIM